MGHTARWSHRRGNPRPAHGWRRDDRIYYQQQRRAVDSEVCHSEWGATREWTNHRRFGRTSPRAQFVDQLIVIVVHDPREFQPRTGQLPELTTALADAQPVPGIVSAGLVFDWGRLVREFDSTEGS